MRTPTSCSKRCPPTARAASAAMPEASNSTDGELFAAVNNGSNTVAIYRRDGNRLRFDKLVTTTSAPVSVDFGHDHLYVAGATTVDSFVLHRHRVEWMDGTTGLELAGGGVPPNGSTAQVGVLNERRLLVTLKTDPDPGTVDIVSLRDGAITGAAPAAVSAPAGTLTPFGFSVYPDGTAVITLAHSGQDGLFRNGAFTSVIGAGQAAPCWTTKSWKIRLHGQYGQQDHQSCDWHREQRLCGQSGCRQHRDRRAVGSRRGRGCPGRDRPRRRAVSLVVVHLQQVWRTHGERCPDQPRRGRRERDRHHGAHRSGRGTEALAPGTRTPAKRGSGTVSLSPCQARPE